MTRAPSTDALLVERREAVAYLTMNRPRVLNVLDETLAAAMATAFASVADDPSVRAVVLAGAGRSFMAGGDLALFHADLAAAPATAAELIDRFHAVMRSIRRMPKPVIAAIHGPVAGGGVGLALACDLVIAADDTTLRSAYTKLGTSPDGGTTWSLTRLLGPRRAVELMLLNEPIDAADALRLGLVNRVVTKADLMPAATALAERLTRTAAGADAAVKRLVQQAVEGSFDRQLDLEKDSFVGLAGTADFREGISAFIEKRGARFKTG
ncbi:enoyl-CoA hydratase/isomerase family protein [Chelatococcus reniformis]|uniref:Enoyl-CoA hydratase n=1 Tax=Chelatococcus reniformis TaxID=1494448 RepID=A0A916TYN7_9HYPH|nr:enoyl-CoA hydratase-related protein [Chelatococcus reniformis]GGC52876.1 enoyl-CoA hydratase [Chelatococcus reniformis]